MSYTFAALSAQNPWWANAANIKSDIRILQFEGSRARWTPRLRHFFDFGRDGVYTLRGPRQVGKTTLIKLMILDLLGGEISPRNVFYWTCDLIEGPEELVDLLESYLRVSEGDSRRFVFLDEISSVRDWQRGVKYLSDTGRLLGVSLVMTGSHSLDIRRAVERLPGRRGDAQGPMDKILMPMKFSEYVETRSPEIGKKLASLDLLRLEQRIRVLNDLLAGSEPKELEELSLYNRELGAYFDDYLITGGIPRALDEYLRTTHVESQTYSTYVDAILGDIMRYDKRETYLVQLLRRIHQTYGTQVSLRTLQKETDMGSVNTLEEYLEVLKASFVLTVLYSLDKEKGTLLYRREKRIHFRDPLIFHALRAWVSQVDPYEYALEFLRSERKPLLVESVLCDHLIRFAFNMNPSNGFDPSPNVSYWRAKKGEVDLVLRIGDNYLPFEVKYASRIHGNELNGLHSFLRSTPGRRGIIATRDESRVTEDYVAVPVRLLLMLF